MKLFNRRKKTYSINKAYENERKFSKKLGYWEEHSNESFYDPMNDFRHITKDKKRKWSLRRRK